MYKRKVKLFRIVICLQLLADTKMKNDNIKTSFVSPKGPNVVILVNRLILQNQCKTKIADYLFLFLKNEVKRK